MTYGPEGGATGGRPGTGGRGTGRGVGGIGGGGASTQTCPMTPIAVTLFVVLRSIPFTD